VVTRRAVVGVHDALYPELCFVGGVVGDVVAVRQKHQSRAAEGFNLLNRFNEASASPLFTDVNAFGERDSAGRYFSRPTATYDQRQFQLGLRFSF
jgi:hypothetical protein